MPSPAFTSASIGTRRSDAAFQHIKNYIHNGRFAPGERLPAERELAQLLHVSRPTLRDALNRLEARGYVERRTGSGNYVCTSIPPAVRTPLEEGIQDRLVTLQQIIAVRKPLEVWGAREAARHRTKPQLLQLRKSLFSMQFGTSSGQRLSPREYARADICFHLVIAKMTANPVYLHTIQFLTDLISQSLSISREILDTDFTRANNEKHRAIFDAIASANPAAAGKAMQAHFVLIERTIQNVEA